MKLFVYLIYSDKQMDKLRYCYGYSENNNVIIINNLDEWIGWLEI